MANTYSWTIQGISYKVGPDSEGHSNVVYNVEWLLTVSDNEDPPTEVPWSGTTSLTRAKGDDWVAYEDLTEADVVGWVEGGFAEGIFDGLKSKLDAQIEEEANPTKLSVSFGNMPWNNDGN